MGLENLSPEEQREMLELLQRHRESQGLSEGEILPSLPVDMGKAAASGVAQGALGVGQLAAMPFAGIAGARNWAVRKLSEAVGEAPPKNLPNLGADVMGALGKASEKVNYRPQTTPGRYVKSVAEGVPTAALGPGSPFLKGLIAVGSGAGAQFADDTIAGGDASQGGNALARFGGGVIGSALPLVVAGRVKNAHQLVHEALSKTSPADFARAKRLEGLMTQHGMPSHIKSQLFGQNSTLDDLVAQASASSNTRPALMGATQNAPKEAGQAMENWLLTNLPPQVSSRRELLGDVQKRAADRIAAGVRLSNAQYTKAMPKDLPNYAPEEMLDLHNELFTLARSDKFVGGEGGKAIERFLKEKLTDADGLPISNPYALNNALKDLNALKKQEGWGGLPTSAIKEALRKYTPEFADARKAKSAVMDNVVEPMQKGLVGDIARMGGGIKPDRYTALESAFTRIFTPDRPQPKEIADFAKHLGKDEFAQFFGEYLRKQVSQNLNRASNVGGPYNFLLAIARTPAQQANLRASLTAAAESMGAKPHEVVKGFSNLMRGFETYKNVKLAGGLNSAEIGAKAGINIPGLFIAPNSRIGRTSFDYVSRKTYAQIIDMVTSPDGLKRLEQIARTKPTSTRMKALVEGLVINSLQGMAAETPGDYPDVMPGQNQPQGVQ